MGREEEGSSSNQPELAAFLLALRDMPIEEPLLYLCKNQSWLKAVTRWIGEGGKATFNRVGPGAPDVDILATAIEILHKRIAAGTRKNVESQSLCHQLLKTWKGKDGAKLE